VGLRFEWELLRGFERRNKVKLAESRQRRRRVSSPTRARRRSGKSGRRTTTPRSRSPRSARPPRCSPRPRSHGPRRSSRTSTDWPRSLMCGRHSRASRRRARSSRRRAAEAWTRSAGLPSARATWHNHETSPSEELLDHVNGPSARISPVPTATAVQETSISVRSFEARQRPKVGSSWRSVVADALERHVDECAVVALQGDAQVELENSVERLIVQSSPPGSTLPRSLSPSNEPPVIGT